MRSPGNTVQSFTHYAVIPQVGACTSHKHVGCSVIRTDSERVVLVHGYVPECWRQVTAVESNVVEGSIVHATDKLRYSSRGYQHRGDLENLTLIRKLCDVVCMPHQHKAVLGWKPGAILKPRDTEHKTPVTNIDNTRNGSSGGRWCIGLIHDQAGFAIHRLAVDEVDELNEVSRATVSSRDIQQRNLRRRDRTPSEVVGVRQYAVNERC
ncbi:hypothetical protein D3C71_1042890 [compost metagenome]